MMEQKQLNISYRRVHNFNAGPAGLPLEVMQQAQAELLDYKGTGMSIMEMSHRSKEFEAVIQTAEADLRELLGIPANYKIMFLQGGASLQFAMLPMNLRAAGASPCGARLAASAHGLLGPGGAARAPGPPAVGAGRRRCVPATWGDAAEARHPRPPPVRPFPGAAPPAGATR